MPQNKSDKLPKSGEGQGSKSGIFIFDTFPMSILYPRETLSKATNMTRDIVDNLLKDVVAIFWKVYLKRNRANFTLNNIATVQIKGEGRVLK